MLRIIAESCYRYAIDPTPGLQQLFGLQDQLYERGARNFCYIDVPPMDRSPACRSAFLDYVSRFGAAYSVIQMIRPCFKAGRKDS